MKRIKSILLFLTVTIYMSGQDSVKIWSLDDCIQYALAHNIQIKRSEINQLSGQEDLALSKALLFPSLSAGISQNYVNYPSGNVATNNAYTGNYNVSTNLTVFDGSRRVNTIKQQEIQQDVNELGVLQSENDIRISLVQAYMQVLYAIESVRINENTVEVSREQLDRGEEMLNVGSISRVDLAQLESQHSSDKYRLVAARTGLDNYKMQLKQLLELDITEEIMIDTPEIGIDAIMRPLSDKATIYETSLSVMPEIRSGELSISLADLDIKKAKAGYLPSLSMNAGIGTGHASGTGTGFDDQVWNRFNGSIGLTLSIPIYSNRENKTAINKAKLASITSELELINTQKQLLRLVEGVYLDATSSQNQYIAAVEQVKAAEESYGLIEEQFNLGMINTLELLTSRNNYLTAQQELLQSKYMAVMSIQLLNIYQQIPVDKI